MLLHLSDLHFGTEKQECLDAIAAFCREHEPEVIVVSGDLTQRARFTQFYSCKQFLDSLGIPYMVIPGNHDIPLYHLWNRFFSPFVRYQFFFGALEPTIETEHFYVIGVNSIRRRYHTRGYISLEQIQKTNELLKRGPAHKLKLVTLHQPFYTPPDEPHGIKDCPVLGRMALNNWSKSGLFGVLHGHLHKTAVYDLNQIYDLQAAHPVYDIHAGTATSYRLYKSLPNSFNVIFKDGQVQHYWFDSNLRQFVLQPAPIEKLPDHK
ncbi:metallophosphoesterase family protein [Acinetobacter soli]|uniref:metallophosphoesterase family protein n=1 Tax=Acinetobacter soli TaxID=487316 RepID=UPI000468A4A6|nr:metallophosphoesterase family protein [Acinetobacter soli]MBU3118673.1 metallophosphoesterase [Acinetobacter soli]MDQ8943092.1 metallophosphoesterase family protein [Acinetobacter soli]MEB4802061.1 metallophosphoesterase family protein [Acinetobacter soli]RSB55185.1 3',5'-cyclic-nucleotide phosphodiesterase [Acinetobacter soli]